MSIKQKGTLGVITALLVVLLLENVYPVQATTVTLEEMRARAEAIVNYEWTPTQRIDVWNENPYNGKMYFEAGETVKGMPYTLFAWELNVDSLLSLEQYKTKTNYSTTAYCTSVGDNRTGPVYG
ncbi:MAG: hypothetical protein IJU16_07490, partial [Clostridia bacterium]|nr:hypothetical protein [Clostridia bacterium]